MAKSGPKNKGKGPEKGKKSANSQKEVPRESERIPSDEDDSDTESEELRRKIAEEEEMDVSEAGSSGAEGSGLQQGERDGDRAEEPEVKEIETGGAKVTRKRAEAAKKRRRQLRRRPRIIKRRTQREQRRRQRPKRRKPRKGRQENGKK